MMQNRSQRSTQEEDSGCGRFYHLASAPATFERLRENVMRGFQWKNLLIYLDDLIIFSKDVSSHLTKLEEIFKRLRKANLKMKPSKCHLFEQKVEYLGHIISSDGVETDPKKVQAVEEWPQPQHH